MNSSKVGIIAKLKGSERVWQEKSLGSVNFDTRNVNCVRFSLFECTGWAFFGSKTLVAETGFDFLSVIEAAPIGQTSVQEFCTSRDSNLQVCACLFCFDFIEVMYPLLSSSLTFKAITTFVITIIINHHYHSLSPSLPQPQLIISTTHHRQLSFITITIFIITVTYHSHHQWLQPVNRTGLKVSLSHSCLNLQESAGTSMQTDWQVFLQSAQVFLQSAVAELWTWLIF